FDIEVPLAVLFDAPVLERFSERIRMLVETPRRQENRIRPADRSRPIPLSYVQERLWFIHEHPPDLCPAYNMSLAWSFGGGEFSVEALRRAFAALVARHESLRTTFVVTEPGSVPVQAIAPSLALDIPLIGAGEADIRALAQAHADHVFDLSAGPL